MGKRKKTAPKKKRTSRKIGNPDDKRVAFKRFRGLAASVYKGDLDKRVTALEKIVANQDIGSALGQVRSICTMLDEARKNLAIIDEATKALK